MPSPRVGRFQSFVFFNGLHSGIMQVGLCWAKLETNLPMTACELLFSVRSCSALPLTLFFLISLYLSSVAVCCSKCILLSSSSCLTPASEENTGRNAAGGREEGSNRDRGRGPLFRNSAGLECLCYTTSVHHWCQQKVGPRVSATAILSPSQVHDCAPNWN